MPLSFIKILAVNQIYKLWILVVWIVIFSGCTSISAQKRQFVVKNLCDWDIGKYDYQSTIEIEIDSNGSPVAAKEVIDSFQAKDLLHKWSESFLENNVKNGTGEISEEERKKMFEENNIRKIIPLNRLRWQIHPKAPLGKILYFTRNLTDMERSEFGTSYGIFIVGAPNYGGRRIPSLDKIGKSDFEYRVCEDRNILRNGKSWTKANNTETIADLIINNLSKNDPGFVNLYFELSPTDTWSEIEEIMFMFLPKIDNMRGLWIGDKDGKVILHFHDISFSVRSQTP